jgi:hypothetical protein
MDDPALRLLQARRVIEAERALRSKAEHELRIARQATALRSVLTRLKAKRTADAKPVRREQRAGC